MRRLALLIATLGPCGFFPVAPATFASLVLAMLYVWVPARAPWWDVVAVLLVSLTAVWAAEYASKTWGKDPRRVVIDEAAGMAVTLFLLPPGVRIAAAGFIAFRIFDILKPFPARRAESLPGGLGIVADDLIAGVYANIVVRLMMPLL